MQLRPFASLLALTASLILAGAAPIGAQQPTLREGSRVKVTTPSQKGIVGVVQSVTTDTLVLFTEPHGGRLGVSIPAIQKVQVSQGRLASEGAKKGALWGAAIGAVTSAIVLVSLQNDQTATTLEQDKVSAGAFAAQNFLGSVVLGAGIGALVKAEKWDTLPLRAGVSAGGGAIALRVSASFR